MCGTNFIVISKDPAARRTTARHSPFPFGGSIFSYAGCIHRLVLPTRWQKSPPVAPSWHPTAYSPQEKLTFSSKALAKVLELVLVSSPDLLWTSSCRLGYVMGSLSRLMPHADPCCQGVGQRHPSHVGRQWNRSVGQNEVPEAAEEAVPGRQKLELCPQCTTYQGIYSSTLILMSFQDNSCLYFKIMKLRWSN